MSIEKSKKKLKIAYACLENGAFLAGINLYAEKSNNFHTRLAIAKLTRAIEKQMEEPFKQYQDLLREFGTKNKDGQMSVIPANLTPVQAVGWAKEIKAWREKEILVESDLVTEGRLTMEMPIAVLNAFPHQFIEALMDHVTFKERVETKESELERLRRENEALTKGAGPKTAEL